MSEKTLKSVLNILKIALMLLGVIITFLIIKGAGVDEDTGKVIPADGQISFGLQLTYAMMIFSFAAAVLFAVYFILFNLKNNITTLIGIGVFVLICVIAYSMSSDSMLESWKYKDQNMFTPSKVKWSDAGLIVMYIFAAITVTAIVAGEMWNLIKRFSK